MNIQQLLIALLQNDYIRSLVETAWRSATGGNPFGLSPITYDSSKTLATNIYNAERSNQAAIMFGGAIDNVVKQSGISASRGFYELLGYSSKEAARRATEGSPLQSLLTDFLTGPHAEAASKAMAYSLMRRKAQWDSRSPLLGTRNVVPENLEYGAEGSALINKVLTRALDGDFSGMGIADTGVIASRMLAIGAFDVRKGENLDARTKRFTKELSAYANSISTLQDVIEGPVENIMAMFERFTGSRMVATSTGRVNAIAQGMRTILSQGDLTEGGLATVIAMQHQYSGAFGANKMLSTSQGLVTAAAISNMPRIENLDPEEFAKASARFNARQLAEGNVREMGAAYAHWRTQHPGRPDDQYSRAAFADDMRKLSGDFNQAVRMYNVQNNLGADWKNSALASAQMSNPELLALINRSTVQRYTDAVANIGQQYGVDLSALEGEYGRGKQQEIIRQALIKSGKYTAQEAGNLSGRIQNEIGAAARRITGEIDPTTALVLVGGHYNAVRTLEENLAESLWGSLGKYANYRQVTGWEGLVQTLQRKDFGAADIGSALGGLFGMDERVMRAAVDKAIQEGKNDADVIAASKQAIMHQTGMSESQVDTYIKLAVQRRGAARVIGGVRAADTSPEASQQRLNLMERVAQGKLSPEDASRYSHLQISASDWNRLLLESKMGREGGVSTEEVKAYDNAIARHRSAGKSDEESHQLGLLELKARARKKELDTKAQLSGRKLTEEEYRTDDELKKIDVDYKRLAGQDTSIVGQVIQDNTVEGVLNRIFNLLVSKLR